MDDRRGQQFDVFPRHVRVRRLGWCRNSITTTSTSWPCSTRFAKRFIVLGVNEFAARSPSALAALVAGLATYEAAVGRSTARRWLLAGVVGGRHGGLCGAAALRQPRRSARRLHRGNAGGLLSRLPGMRGHLVELADLERRYGPGASWPRGRSALVQCRSRCCCSFLTWERQWRRLKATEARADGGADVPDRRAPVRLAWPGKTKRGNGSSNSSITTTSARFWSYDGVVTAGRSSTMC